jgi:hypothetical protein
MAAMQDFLKDWRRWSKAERVAAVMLASGLVAVLPTTVAVSRLLA